jgi:transportin-3
MAICALAVQMQWKTFCHDVLHFQFGLENNVGNAGGNAGNAGGVPPQVQQGMVLELLTLLPEECCSHRLLVVPEEQVQEFTKSLVDSSHSVLTFLQQCLLVSNGDGAAGAGTSNGTGTGASNGEGVLKCLLSWITYIPVPPQLLKETPLLPWIFGIVTAGHGNTIVSSVQGMNMVVQGDMFDLATDLIIQLLKCYPSHHDSHMGLVHALIPLVMALGGGGSKTVTNTITTPTIPVTPTTPFDKALHDEDSDALRAYCRIFTEMGESYLSLIFHPQDLNQSALVEQILSCSAIPELEVATITLHFWYRFVTWMEDLQPYEYRQYQVDTFTPQLMKLTVACTSLLRYPSDLNDMAQDQKEDVYRDRFYVMDTLEDCCRLLGGQAVLNQVGQQLQAECARVSSLPPDQQLNQWQGIESCLMALSATARYIARDEGVVLPFVMKLLPELPSTVHLLRATANKLIGSYAMWLDVHPNHLQPLLPYLAQSLSSADCASSAAVAIKELCENCSTKFALGDSVLQLYDGIVVASSQQQQQSQSHQSQQIPPHVFNLKDELEVLEGACKAVSRQLQEMASAGTSSEGFSNYIGRLVQPIGERLASFATPTSTAGPKLILADIERLTVVVRFLKIPNTNTNVSARSQFLIDLMTQCWPLLDTLSQKYIKDVNLAEKLCRLHKHVLRECGAGAYKPLLDHLRVHLVRNYSASHASPYLYAASVCIGEYANDPTCLDRLYETFTELSNATFGLLQHHENFVSHPDVVEELFFLADRMVSRCPALFFCSPLLHSYIQCASVGMKLDHRDANRGTLTFIESVLGYGLDLSDPSKNNGNNANGACKDALEKVISTEGEQIVRNLVLSLKGELPCYRITYNSGSIAGILFKLKTLCPSLLGNWVQNSLASDQEILKSVLMNAIVNLCSREEFFESVRRYESICERNRKMGGN